MGILKFNTLIVFQTVENLIKKNHFSIFQNMIKCGANIIDVGGESTRPGSKTINSKLEWNRIKDVIKILRKNIKIFAYLWTAENLDIMIKGIKVLK